MGDHYEALGVRRDASKSDIKNAYFRQAHRHHPDHHAEADAATRAAAATRFRQAKDAYDVLSDDRRRADYDRRSRSGYTRRGQGGGESYSSTSSSGSGRRQSGSYSSSSSGYRNQHEYGGGYETPNFTPFNIFLWGVMALATFGEFLEELGKIRQECQKMRQDWEQQNRERDNRREKVRAQEEKKARDLAEEIAKEKNARDLAEKMKKETKQKTEFVDPVKNKTSNKDDGWTMNWWDS